ncbi:hypothetical protein QBC42DRAFT_71812 [Cladorrhinum samala]|uniref:Uncharacterized protein n=1 Tax=Cladorrhinum samala TaxID=585594 RepID=A0AAV9HTL9_9PEZI|nr:hypothetical protein QBC42DRAFT_71812 [Cladorrhinum samala]
MDIYPLCHFYTVLTKLSFVIFFFFFFGEAIPLASKSSSFLFSFLLGLSMAETYTHAWLLVGLMGLDVENTRRDFSV